jgi:hypothetical protein
MHSICNENQRQYTPVAALHTHSTSTPLKAIIWYFEGLVFEEAHPFFAVVPVDITTLQWKPKAIYPCGGSTYPCHFYPTKSNNLILWGISIWRGPLLFAVVPVDITTLPPPPIKPPSLPVSGYQIFMLYRELLKEMWTLTYHIVYICHKTGTVRSVNKPQFCLISKEIDKRSFHTSSKWSQEI